MRRQEGMRSQGHTCVLKVDNIHCDGCKGKIRKLLMKIDGVQSISIDMEQGRVAVTGNIDPALLIRKLEKLGKHAEIWRNNHSHNNKNIQFDALNNQFRSLQVGNIKGGGDKKHYNKHQPLQQEMKGYKDLKAQKTVKFDLPKKHHGFDEFSEDDEFDEDFGDEDDEFDDEEFGFGGRQHGQNPVNGGRKGKVVGKEKKGGKKGKKKEGGGGGGFMAMIGRAIGRKGKKVKVGKKGASVGNKSKGGPGGAIQKYEGKIGNKGGVYKGGEGKNGKFSDFEVTNHHIKGGGHGRGGGGGMGQYRAPGAQGVHPQGRQQVMMNMGGGGGMGQYRAPGPQQPQGPQMMMNMGGGGNEHYPSTVGGPMGQMNPYYQQQQQQYMAMMMNQQRMMDVGGGGDMMYNPGAAYGRPYGPPVPPSPVRVPGHDPYAHMFSDENTESCSIM